jgi:hypothetical protein
MSGFYLLQQKNESAQSALSIFNSPSERHSAPLMPEHYKYYQSKLMIENSADKYNR